MPRWVSSVDAFRSVPKDLAEASLPGAVMTIIAVATCSLLFLCETRAFLASGSRSEVVIDSNQDALLRINFDVTLLDVACDYVTLGIWDAFGRERINITHDIQKRRIDHKGVEKGHFYSEEELMQLELPDTSFNPEKKEEEEWHASSEAFKEGNFQSVINTYDFTFVFFFADWCPYCEEFAPTFTSFQQQVDSGEAVVVDADGARANIKVLKLNCADYEETCESEKVNSYPTMRLYRRGDTGKGFVAYTGKKSTEGLLDFVKDQARQRHMHQSGKGVHYHDVFAEGCRIFGNLEVARVPGTLHFQATHAKGSSFNLAYTNVSHIVNHFSFGDAWTDEHIKSLPSQYRRHAAPIDGRMFVVDKFHMAPHHFIKVVHTRWEDSEFRSYQQTHQWSVRTLPRKMVPQAKFSYDLSPVEVILRKSERRWYDYTTSVFAIIGGAFTFMSMVSGLLNLAGARFKASISKLG